MTRKSGLEDRLQRAGSWINAAAKLSSSQQHEAFIFYYIALSAMYGQRRYEGNRAHVHDDLRDFLDHVKEMHIRDGGRTLATVLERLQDYITALILDYFLLDALFRGAARGNLVKWCERDLLQAQLALNRGNVVPVLDVCLRRLTVLRNRVMHGCVTYGPTSKGLPSIVKGLRVIREIVPAFHALMTKYGRFVSWPAIPYPRVGFEDPLERLDPNE